MPCAIIRICFLLLLLSTAVFASDDAPSPRLVKSTAIGCERVLLGGIPFVELTAVEEAKLRGRIANPRAAALSASEEALYSEIVKVEMLESKKRSAPGAVKIPAHSPKRAPFDRLTPFEAEAIGVYTANAYASFNRSLRTLSQTGRLDFNSIEDVAWVTLLVSALAKLPDYVGVVSRGANLSKENLETLEARYVPGSVVTEPAFLSTSPGSAVHPRFLERGKAYFTIHSKTGKEITALSFNRNSGRRYPGETEVLFAPNAKFFVESFRWENVTINGNERRRAFIVLREAE